VIFGLLAVLGVLASLPLLVGSDARSRLLATNSLLLAAGTGALALPWGTALAALLTRTDMPGRKLAMILVGAMLFVPLYLQSAGWQAGLGLGGWYAWVREAAMAEPLLSGWRGAIWIHGVAALPWVTGIVALGMITVASEYEELALLDGSPRQVFWHATLRHAWASVGVAALWILVTTAGEMTVTDIFQLRTYAEEIYTGFALGDDLQSAPLTVLPGAIIIAWLTIAALIVCLHVLPPQTLAQMRPLRLYELGRWRWVAMLFVAATLLVLVGIPLKSLICQAGVAMDGSGDGSWPAWSFGHFIRTFASSPLKHAEEFGWTVLTGVLAASVTTAIAVALAWPARLGGLRAAPLLVIIAICLAMPGPLVGIGLIKALSWPGASVLQLLRDRTIFAPCAAQVIRSLPLTALVVWQALRTVPRETIEMAIIDGAGPWSRLIRVALPQRLPALAAAWLIALAIAMGDVAGTASDMVTPPGVDLLSRRIAGMLHGSVYDQIAGICLANTALFVMIAATAIWLLSRRRG
jgi:iron(III) transport system permease protein